MATTYEKIATTTLGSSAADFTLSSIPATYTDLRLIIVGKGNGGEIYPEGYFNGVTTGGLYSNTLLNGNGTSATSGRNTGANRLSLGAPQYPNNTIFTFITIDIFSYAGSTFKTLLTTVSTDKNGTGGVNATVSLFRSTSALTSITITDGGSGFGWAAGTSATLYGILKA
jgi:hypothetical protein